MGRQAAAMLVKLLISLPKAFKAVLMSRMEGEMKGAHVLLHRGERHCQRHTHHTHTTQHGTHARTQLTR
jgi:hypothetical protein